MTDKMSEPPALCHLKKRQAPGTERRKMGSASPGKGSGPWGQGGTGGRPRGEEKWTLHAWGTRLFCPRVSPRTVARPNLMIRRWTTWRWDGNAGSKVPGAAAATLNAVMVWTAVEVKRLA